MDIVTLAVTLIVIIAFAAIIYWFITASGITIPRPFQIALMAILAIVAILVLAHLAGLGNGQVIRI